MKYIKTFILGSTLSFFMLSPVIAQEMDHSKHSAMEHSKYMKKKTSGKQKLGVLKTVPESGKAREAGYDGKHIMETTTIKDSLKTQCAKASRGLIMLDNKSWDKCGGKPKGLAKGPGIKTAQPMDHSQHSNH